MMELIAGLVVLVSGAASVVTGFKGYDVDTGWMN